MGPIYHQVPIATETVGDFICVVREENEYFNVVVNEGLCAEPHSVQGQAEFLFSVVPAAGVAIALNRKAG